MLGQKFIDLWIQAASEMRTPQNLIYADAAYVFTRMRSKFLNKRLKYQESGAFKTAGYTNYMARLIAERKYVKKKNSGYKIFIEKCFNF